MFLEEIGVENFRSIESGRLPRLAQYNLLIGQNNVGKSSLQEVLFLTMLHISAAPQHVTPRREGLSALRNCTVRLHFRLSHKERRDFLGLLVDQSQTEKERILSSPFLQEMELKLSFHGDYSTLFLEDFSVLAIDGLASIYRAPEGGNRTTTTGGWTSWANVVQRKAFTRNDIEEFRDIGGSGSFTDFGNLARFPEMVWMPSTVRDFARSVYMSSALRFGPPSAAPYPSSQLWSDASNLIQVLETLRTGNSDKFQRIEDFVSACLPNIQRVQIPWIEVSGSSQKQVTLRTGNLSRPLSDFGSGTEQLLILATILATTSDEGLILLEEPENHLHPSAQRFIVDQLSSINRQVLVSSHSSIFIDSASPDPSIYHLTLAEGKTRITKCVSLEALGRILRDIGAKNSDVLLSNAVCFVEDRVDGEVLEVLAQQIGISFAKLGISMVPTKGSSRSRTVAGVGTQLLKTISQGTPIPHVFVFDRDEWPKSELLANEQAAPGHVHFLHCRELENLLLAPGAVADVIRIDLLASGREVDEIELVTTKNIDALISEAASAQEATVYRRRIRKAIQIALRYPRIDGFDITPLIDQPSEEIALQFRRWHDNETEFNWSIEAITAAIDQTRQEFSADWSDDTKYRTIAPGEEILTQVFDQFGLNFDKASHNRRIAAAMTVDDMDNSTIGLLKAISDLVSISNSGER